MHRKRILALCGATLGLVLAPPALAAAGPSVTVRVEGLNRTLLVPTLTHTHTGSITRYGAPRGKCPATSADGALDVATHHRWRGIWEGASGFADYEITSILRETHPFTAKYYWGFWIDNRYASTGVCETPLHRGDQLLFAADSVSKHEHPIGVRAPRSAVAGHSFKVKVVWYADSGASKPLAGARVQVGSISVVTNRQGAVTIAARHAGPLSLRAVKKGYIRSAPVIVHVSS